VSEPWSSVSLTFQYSLLRVFFDFLDYETLLRRPENISIRARSKARPVVSSRSLVIQLRSSFIHSEMILHNGRDSATELYVAKLLPRTMKIIAARGLRCLEHLAGSTHALVGSRGVIRRGALLHRSVQLPRSRRVLLTRGMTSAYSGDVGDGTLGLDKLSSYVPFQTIVKDRKVEIGPFKASEDGWTLCFGYVRWTLCFGYVRCMMCAWG
jgi:hypothetical protein